MNRDPIRLRRDPAIPLPCARISRSHAKAPAPPTTRRRASPGSRHPSVGAPAAAHLRRAQPRAGSCRRFPGAPQPSAPSPRSWSSRSGACLSPRRRPHPQRRRLASYPRSRRLRRQPRSPRRFPCWSPRAPRRRERPARPRAPPRRSPSIAENEARIDAPAPSAGPAASALTASRRRRWPKRSRTSSGCERSRGAIPRAPSRSPRKATAASPAALSGSNERRWRSTRSCGSGVARRQRRGARGLERYPDSPVAERIRWLLGQSPHR